MTPSVSRWRGDVVARLSRHRAAASAPVCVQQFWADLTFVHWPVRPEDVAHLFPPGTRPDVFDGKTYAGLIPFTMRATALGSALPLPYFGTFHETNVRLYSIDDAGRHGVVFRSLETARLAVVPVVRAALGVPYTWARMRITRSGDQISYDSQRRWPRRGLRSRLTVRIGDAVEPTPLEVWLSRQMGRAHPQGRADVVGAQRARAVAVAIGRGPRTGRRSDGGRRY